MRASLPLDQQCRLAIYGLDPGTEQSALVGIDATTGAVIGSQILANAHLVMALRELEQPGHLVIEQVESYGMAVGREVFETVFWAGRFAQAWQAGGGTAWSLLPRRAVKLTLCGSARAKDANIRRALLDLYGGDAAGKKGGPLYGVKTHLWAALAVAVTFREQNKG